MIKYLLSQIFIFHIFFLAAKNNYMYIYVLYDGTWNHIDKKLYIQHGSSFKLRG